MKNFISFTIAVVFIGFTVYAIMHWLAGFSNAESIGYGIAAVAADVIVNFVLKPYYLKYKSKRSA